MPPARPDAIVTDPPAPEPDGPAVFNVDIPHARPDRPLSEAARRALLEAADRRAADTAIPPPTEHGGPSGPEPTRYGDWEKKGLTVDF